MRAFEGAKSQPKETRINTRFGSLPEIWLAVGNEDSCTSCQLARIDSVTAENTSPILFPMGGISA